MIIYSNIFFYMLHEKLPKGFALALIFIYDFAYLATQHFCVILTFS